MKMKTISRRFCSHAVVIAVLLVSVVESATATVFKTIDFSSSHNWRMQDFGVTNAPYLPEGEQTFGGVPFNIPSGGDNVWLSSETYLGEPDVLEIAVTEYGVDGVHTLINTAGGLSGSPAYAKIEFYIGNDLYHTKELLGDDDIRDYYFGNYTNSINGTTTVNVFSYGDGQYDEVRLDKQWIDLPDVFNTATLTKIVLTDIGAPHPGQDPFLAGVTVEVPEPTMVLLLGLGGLVLLRKRRG